MTAAQGIPLGLLGFGFAHVLAAGVTAFLAIRMHQYYRGESLGRSFSVVVGTLTVWLLGAVVEMWTRLTLDPTVYAVGAGIKFVGVMGAPVAFFLFALRYDGRDRWIDRRLVMALSLVPLLGILLALTNVSHGLFYPTIVETTFAGRAVLYATVGPGWWIASAYGYLLLFGSTLLFVHAGMTRWPYYRFETAFVLGGIGLTWATNLAYVLGEWPHPVVDPTPIGLTVTSVLLAVGIFSTRLMDVPLPGRFRVYEAIDDAILVLDDRNRIVDANEAAKAVIGTDPDRGEPADTLLPWFESGAPAESESTVAEIEVDGVTRWFKYRHLDAETAPTGWTVLVLTDISDELETERLRAQRDAIADQRDHLQTLDSVVRHDIRNDLQIVSAYAETLENRLEGEAQTYAERIRKSAADAIKFTKSAGDLAETILAADGELEPVGLRETMWAEVDTLQSRYDDAVVTVDGEIPDVGVKADEMLGSVVRNLIENAIRHSHREVPKVTVSAAVDGDRVTIRVADNGPGVPDAVGSTIFEEGEMDGETGGTGLGLSLVDALVERYGGEVSVEDREPTGSVFIVELAKAA